MIDTSKVTRFEIIDHRPCEECEGTGWVAVPYKKNNPKQQQCIGCHGAGYVGRTVVGYDEKLKFDLSLQDEGRTLKVFVNER